MLTTALLLALQPTSATPPRPIEPGTWVTPADYLSSTGREGTAGVRLTIDRSGTVIGCEIVRSAGLELDSLTCRLLVQRARFEPARDSGGNLMESTLSTNIDWSRPEIRRVPFAPAQVIVELRTPRRAAPFCRVSSRGEMPEALAVPGCPAGATATEPPRQAHFLEHVVTNLLPEGQRPSFRVAVPGRPSARLRVAFEVDERGIVVHCQPLGTHRSNSPEAAQERERCSELSAGGLPIFEVAAPNSGRRRGVLETTQTLEAF